MKNTQFKVEDVFGDVKSKDSILTEQTSELKIFFSQDNVNMNINIKFNLFTPRKEKLQNYEPSAPPYYEEIFVMKRNEKQTHCLGRRNLSFTNKFIEYEKVNPKLQKPIEFMNGTCSICEQNKS